MEWNTKKKKKEREEEKRNEKVPTIFEPVTGQYPRRLRVELVFNSESFVREAIFLG